MSYIRHRESSVLMYIVSAFLVYIILILLLLQPLIGWLAFGKSSENSILTAVNYDKDNAVYYYMLGRYYYLNLTTPDLDKSIQYYKKSLSLNPLQSGAWIDISKVYQLKNQNAEAEYALERALKLSPANSELMWEAGIFWLINNMTDKAVITLKKYLLLLPDNQNKVYDMCWKLHIDNTYILDNLVPDLYAYQSQYLQYLMRTKRTDESQEVWNRLDKNSLEKSLFISYMNFLLNNSMYEKAETVWKETTLKIEGLAKNEGSSLVWNPSFENEMLNGGFDWIIGKAEGVEIFIDDVTHMTGNRSIGITFDGKHNPDITIIQQTVMVNPNSKYILKSQIKTESLTTNNGIIIQVLGHNCKGLNKKSEAVTGTNFWREVSIDFETPADCKAARILIRRELSNKFDNKIEGTAWIDGIILKQQAELLKSNLKKP